MQVKCTQCGGDVPVEMDQGLATCPYCSSSLFLSLREGLLHYVLGPVIQEQELGKILRTYLERKE